MNSAGRFEFVIRITLCGIVARAVWTAFSSASIAFAGQPFLDMVGRS